VSSYLRVNQQIRAPELRIIGPEGENFGVLPTSEALAKAEELDLDLIEISPNTSPPVAKITDYGKFQYTEKKKQKLAKAKSHVVEVKDIQIKIGTGEHDLALKAKRVSNWLKEGQRVKVGLFLPGRTKYMDQAFLKERLERILKLITEKYKVAEGIKKNPKGLIMIIEKE